ncbi:MAG: alpha/beta hydrolase, partial [Lachnospiraceae bacterium]|nr:alpha/beta hydrolase [Lachnospiraceae bacterium]
DCGFTSPKEIWKHVTEKGLHLSYHRRDPLANNICRKKIQMGNQDYSTLDALEQNQVPVLFIHGSDDDFVPIEMTYENFKKCKAEKRLLVVPGAGHAMSYYTDKKRYEETVLDFWADFDGITDYFCAVWT